MANIAPSGQDGIRTNIEEGIITFSLADFGFSDSDGHGFAGVLISTLPTSGQLLYGRSGMVAGQFVLASDIAAGRLSFLPDRDGNGSPYTSFTFQVRDTGGMADGGTDTDPSPNMMTINIIAQPDGPVIRNFEGTAGGYRVAFTESAGPVDVDVFRDATLHDVDSVDFDGGLLRIGFPSNTADYPGYEDFSIAERDGITVTHQGTGGEVRHDGIAIGVITIDRDGLLEVSFNSEATPARVQQLVRNLTYNLTGNDAPSGTRSPVLVIKDGDGGEALLTGIRIDLTGVDDAPTLADLSSSVTYDVDVFADGPQLIDGDVTFYEPDNSLRDGYLRIGGMVAGDTVAVRNQGMGDGQISVQGTGIYYHRSNSNFSDLIATFSGGSSTTGPLVIEFTSNATAARVEQVIENLTFYNDGENPQGSRTLSLSLTDRVGNAINQNIQIQIGNAITGTEGNDVLTGTPGNDVIDGGAGQDSMSGGDGNDTFYIDHSGDVASEAVGGGSDTVLTSVDYILSPESEIEVLQTRNVNGVDALRLTGNQFGQVIDGNAGDNVLRGGNGDDIIFGFIGNDVLNGDGGGDKLYGQLGDDTYYVDGFDDVYEDINGGTDRVAASTTFMLTPNSSIEVLEAATVSGVDRFDLTGNAHGQMIAGNYGVNVLRGEAGDDSIYGYSGDDYLVGGTGQDILAGGLGHDTYYIDDTLDTIVENAGEGVDRIATSVSISIAADQSIEVLEVINSTSSFEIDLTGNAFDNVIAGNLGTNALRGREGNDVLAGYAGADYLDGGDGDDVLIGGIGGDTLEGGRGSDKYYIEDVEDVVFEAVAPGEDVIASSVSYLLAEGADIERLEPITFGSTETLDFTGNEFGTHLIGNNGANRLDGGLGGDTLEGLGGSDSFAFTTGPGGSNVDRISDFASGVDRILLDDSVFSGLTPGVLADGAFNIGTAAKDVDDRIIYDFASGQIWFDSDGTGSATAIHFATMSSGLTPNATDFFIV